MVGFLKQLFGLKVCNNVNIFLRCLARCGKWEISFKNTACWHFKRFHTNESRAPGEWREVNEEQWNIPSAVYLFSGLSGCGIWSPILCQYTRNNNWRNGARWCRLDSRLEEPCCPISSIKYVRCIDLSSRNEPASRFQKGSDWKIEWCVSFLARL